MLFPDGIYIENNKFRTTQISPILSLIQEQKDLKKEGESNFGWGRRIRTINICL